jgi:hypothetical protein
MTDAAASMTPRREEAEDPRPGRAVRVIPACSTEGEEAIEVDSEHPFEAFRHATFHPATTFAARLSMASALIQAQVDRLPTRFVPRIQVTTLLTLEELALLLPPAEQRLLAHLQSGAPLNALLETPGFRNRKRRDDRLRLLLSRIAVYCGRAVHRRFVRRYLGKRRSGRARTLVPRERLPQFSFFVPPYFAAQYRDWLTNIERSPESVLRRQAELQRRERRELQRAASTRCDVQSPRLTHPGLCTWQRWSCCKLLRSPGGDSCSVRTCLACSRRSER